MATNKDVLIALRARGPLTARGLSGALSRGCESGSLYTTLRRLRSNGLVVRSQAGPEPSRRAADLWSISDRGLKRLGWYEGLNR